ncbi:hypothetical protein [Flindersiella endophytica]
MPVPGGLVAAVVAVAAGGDVELALETRVVPLQGTLSALPLGVTCAGVLALVAVYALPLRRREPGSAGLAVRAGATLLSCGVLAWLVTLAGTGTVELPGRGAVDCASSRSGGRCRRSASSCWRRAGSACSAGSRPAWFRGRPQVAGLALLGAPNAVGLAVPYGLGVPFVVDVPGLDGLPEGCWPRLVAGGCSVIIVLAIGLRAARPVRAALAAGGTLLACALLTSVSGELGFGGFGADLRPGRRSGRWMDSDRAQQAQPE